MSLSRAFAGSMAGVLSLVLVGGCAPPPEPLDPSGTYEGQTYEQWAVRWFRWVNERSTPNIPYLDQTGEHCAEGQSGSVFFLAGTGGGSATRNCTIPHGAYLFFPLIEGAFDNGGVPTAGQLDAGALQAAAEEALVAPTTLTLNLDGHEYTGLSPRFRLGPTRFSYVVPPPPNSYSVTTGADVQGPVDPSFLIGHWVMFPPLSAGSHTLHFTASIGSGSSAFSLDVTYHLTVL